MEKIELFVKNYWLYYLRMEDKFFATLNYVEFDSINLKTFSLEYLNLLLSVCSEIDTVGKMMAHERNESFKEDDRGNGIKEWWKEIEDSFLVGEKRLNEQKANFLDKKTLCPWNRISSDHVPSWWISYNKVKHNRISLACNTSDAKYIDANLENVANAFAALYILEHAFLRSIATDRELRLMKKSKLFEKEERFITGVENNNLCMRDEKVI